MYRRPFYGDTGHFMATLAIGEEANKISDIFIKNDTDDVINVKISQIQHLQIE